LNVRFRFGLIMREAWCNKGVGLDRVGRVEEAAVAFQKAIKAKPAYVEGWTNLASVLIRLGKDEETLEFLTHAAAAFPNHPEIAVQFGNALRRAGRLDEAVAALRRAVERRPEYAEAYNNLGVALHDAGMLDQAEAALRKSIELKPDYPDPHWNLSLLLLHRGDYHGGWLEYEWRRHLKEDSLGQRNFPQPPWSGGPLTGRRVLVMCEQGLGDTLQFIRFARVLAERGAKVIVECQPRLANLLKRVEGIEKIVARGEPLPPFDCHVRLMSIAGILGIVPESIPSSAGYIQMDAGAVSALTVIGQAPGAGGDNDLMVTRLLATNQITVAAAGLTGTYYDNVDFTGNAVTRVDSTLDFNWSSGTAPVTGIAASQFSAEWAGQIVATTTGAYTIGTTADDGVMLYVDGKLLISALAGGKIAGV